MTSLSPVPVEPLFRRPRDLCADISFFYVHIHERFRSNRTSGKWSKKGNRRTDGRPDGRTSALLYLRSRWPQIKTDRESFASYQLERNNLSASPRLFFLSEPYVLLPNYHEHAGLYKKTKIAKHSSKALESTIQVNTAV